MQTTDQTEQLNISDGQESVEITEETVPETVPETQPEITDGNVEEQSVKPPQKRKYGWVGYIFLVAVIALGVYLMFTVVANIGDEVKSFDEVILASDWRYALVSLAAVLIVFACIWFEYLTVTKTTTGKCYAGTSLKVAFIGKFYDNITPFATGGQPMQIYCLNKKGLHGGVSSAIVLIRYFAWMFCWLLISVIFMACSTGVLENQHTYSKLLLLIAGWTGLVINMLIPVVLILFVVLPKFSHALISFIINLGCKIKVVKNKQGAMQKVDKIVSDFRSCFRIMSRKPLNFIILILLCVVEILITYAFPFFVMKMFAGAGNTDGITVLFSVMALNIYATFSASVVPTPGNSGAIEGLVTAAFSAIAGNVLLWTVFGWRFGMYYIYIIIGLGITIFEFIQRLVKRKRSTK